MIREAISRLVTGNDLTEEEMVATMEEIMGGDATPAQVAAFITALRMKGETIDEIAGGAQVMRRHATTIDAGGPDILVDTCGTGGDSSGTFNVSTASAFVVAAAGVPVAKHGNRSVSSHCGSADVLEALGVRLDLSPDQVGGCIRTVGIGFMFAPLLHPAMKHAIGPRREIGIRTIFNLLGPLTNPAGANVQVMGVYDPHLTEPLAAVLGRLGARRALVVCGDADGRHLDELTVTGPTRVSDYHDGAVTTTTVTPEALGLSRADLAELAGGGDAAEAAAILRGVLAGEDTGPRRDMVLLNAGAALMAAGLAADLEDGLRAARDCIDSGKALAKLDELVRYTNEVMS